MQMVRRGALGWGTRLLGRLPGIGNDRRFFANIFGGVGIDLRTLLRRRRSTDDDLLVTEDQALRQRLEVVERYVPSRQRAHPTRASDPIINKHHPRPRRHATTTDTRTTLGEYAAEEE